MSFELPFEFVERLREQAEGHGQPRADRFTVTIPQGHFYKSDASPAEADT